MAFLMPKIRASTTHSIISTLIFRGKSRRIGHVGRVGISKSQRPGLSKEARIRTSSGGWGKNCTPRGNRDGLKIFCRASNEDSTASVDGLSNDSGLLKELEKVEIAEPEAEQKAENAAIYVGAAVAFGAAVWLVLGRTKAEGKWAILGRFFSLSTPLPL